MYSIYQEWLDAHAALQEAKANELRIRNAICETHLDDQLEGSKSFHHDHFKITVTNRLNRTIDKVVLDSLWEDLPDHERECIDFKPSLKLADYRKVEETGGLLTEAITVKPGQASLKITVEDIE